MLSYCFSIPRYSKTSKDNLVALLLTKSSTDISTIKQQKKLVYYSKSQLEYSNSSDIE